MSFMRLSPMQKRDLGKIAYFCLFSFVGALIYVMLEQGILGESTFYPSTGNTYNFETSLISAITSSLFLGFIFGLLEVTLFNKVLKKLSFGRKMLMKALIYGCLIIAILCATSLISDSIITGSSLFDDRSLNNFKRFLTNFALWSINAYIFTLVFLTLLFLEINDYLGQGVLQKFLIGKYHEPREEKRIFMFLDMKSSTTIAEQLGHIKYYKLLNEYYADITQSVLSTSGEIYQYVGDEIIVSWELNKGLKNNNCLECFFRAKDIFEKLDEKYLKNFGLVPEFKAGFHLGEVTTGEIGVIKKEIVFTGDVLNTTSRIQGSCNDYCVDILISADLANLIPKGNYQTTEIGEIELRGKNEKLYLFTLEVTH